MFDRVVRTLRTLGVELDTEHTTPTKLLGHEARFH